MIVRFKKTNPQAVLPFKTYNSDFCYDCVATSREEIYPGVYKYGLGFALQVIRDIRPRSSIYKSGMMLSNSVGTVDENYTNEISAVFYHLNKDLPPSEVGDRVCQLALHLTPDITFIEVDELEVTDRGLNGFGSTGK